MDKHQQIFTTLQNTCYIQQSIRLGEARTPLQSADKNTNHAEGAPCLMDSLEVNSPQIPSG